MKATFRERRNNQILLQHINYRPIVLFFGVIPADVFIIYPGSSHDRSRRRSRDRHQRMTEVSQKRLKPVSISLTQPHYTILQCAPTSYLYTTPPVPNTSTYKLIHIPQNTSRKNDNSSNKVNTVVLQLNLAYQNKTSVYGKHMGSIDPLCTLDSVVVVTPTDLAGI